MLSFEISAIRLFAVVAEEEALLAVVCAFAAAVTAEFEVSGEEEERGGEGEEIELRSAVLAS